MTEVQVRNKLPAILEPLRAQGRLKMHNGVYWIKASSSGRNSKLILAVFLSEDNYLLLY